MQKIERETFIGQIADGLDMIDLSMFTKTIRLKWIYLLNNES